MLDPPKSVLFACTTNSVRSPMAETMLKHLHGTRIYVESVGVRTREIDGFVIAVMDEVGMDLTAFRPKSFDNLEDNSFDLVVTLSPEAQHRAVELTRTMACKVEYWPTHDPTVTEGSREVRLEAYRQVRESLSARIVERFPLPRKPA